MGIISFIEWLDYPLWVWFLIILYLTIPVVFYVILPKVYEYRYYSSSAEDFTNKKKQVLVIVLGDLGHSPRMLYHAKSFLDQGYKVELCGYVSSKLPPFIVNGIDAGSVEVNEIQNLNSVGGNKIVRLIKKVMLQHWILFRIFFKGKMKNSQFVILQNPPVLPILHILFLWKAVYSPVTKIIVDWHNLNYSMLQIKFESNDKTVKLIGLLLVHMMKWYEFNLSKVADYNLTVSANMRDLLIKSIHPNYNSGDKLQKSLIERKFIVLYDRPAEAFKVLTTQKERSDLMYGEFADIFQDPLLADFDFVNGKDKVVISSTSFTKDEDFNILIDGLKEYDRLAVERPFPKLFVIVTGRGPERDEFLRKIDQVALSARIKIINNWFSMDEYPKILSIADLAVSLHLSSSGVDLPMKILDFFGSGVPTVSVNFDTIGELVKNETNGLVVKENTAKQLCEAIVKLATDKTLYNTVKAGAVAESKKRWAQNWNDTMQRVLG